jgi:hypothetical protein
MQTWQRVGIGAKRHVDMTVAKPFVNHLEPTPIKRRRFAAIWRRRSRNQVRASFSLEK